MVEWLHRDPPFSTALVEFAGVRRQVNMACVPDAQLGDYVLVHAGIAISQVQPAEAAKVLATLEQLDAEQAEFEEWKGVGDWNGE
jgi:hydrogenase expression/formation protein HypC